MTVKEITHKIRQFRDERDWAQFHNPKDMAEAICIEAAELLEHFLWKSPDQSVEAAEDRKDAVADELADEDGGRDAHAPCTALCLQLR